MAKRPALEAGVCRFESCRTYHPIVRANGTPAGGGITGARPARLIGKASRPKPEESAFESLAGYYTDTAVIAPVS